MGIWVIDLESFASLVYGVVDRQLMESTGHVTSILWLLVTSLCHSLEIVCDLLASRDT